jgi:hypothetical protein
MANSDQADARDEPASERDQHQSPAQRKSGDDHDRTPKDQSRKPGKYEPQKRLRRVVE